jgi:hypothetical protein
MAPVRVPVPVNVHDLPVSRALYRDVEKARACTDTGTGTRTNDLRRACRVTPES